MKHAQWVCTLKSEVSETDGPAFHVRQCLECYEVGWQLGDEYVAYKVPLPDYCFEFEQFLKDLFAACKAVGEGSISLGFDAVYKADDVLRWLNSAIILNFGELRIEIWHKPRSFDKRPVALSISYYGSENVTVRTNASKLLQFCDELMSAIEKNPSLADLLPKEVE